MAERPQHTLSAKRPWRLLHQWDYVHALGAMTGGQAVQMVRVGLEAIYVSGWQAVADANLSEQVYPDQSMYPANSVPSLVRRTNNALLRADRVEWRPRDQRRGFPRPPVPHLAGFHARYAAMFELASQYATKDMTAYVALQEREFELEAVGYTATRHQREVGAGYFDEVAKVISGGQAATLAMVGSTEVAQFDQEGTG